MRLCIALVLSLGLSSGLVSQQPPTQAPASTDPGAAVEIGTAKIEQVFKMEDDGFQFIAYQITYRGKHVIAEDSICSTNLSVGDNLRFIVCRNDLSKSSPKGKKLLAFIVHLAQN